MVFVFLLALGVEPQWTWLLLPVVLVLLFVFTTAVSMIVSSLFPRFRDLAIIWSVARRSSSTRRPVLYPLEIVPETLRDVMLLNPLAPIFELGRKWVIDPTAPGPGGLAGGCARLLPAVVIFVRRLRLRRVGLQPRGAADRGGAVTRGRGSPWRRSPCSSWAGSR